jgi:hypothetical protein
METITDKGIQLYSDEVYWDDFDILYVENAGSGKKIRTNGYALQYLEALPAYDSPEFGVCWYYGEKIIAWSEDLTWHIRGDDLEKTPVIFEAGSLWETIDELKLARKGRAETARLARKLR